MVRGSSLVSGRRWRPPIVEVGAAPHLPAGILSPYSDGEKGAAIADFANHKRCKMGAEIAASPLLPVTIRGEVP
ncbi:hypothetical protein EOD10_36525, partial [Mesorhizobium sp. M7A.T.Ca.TU.009.01.3.2]